MTESTECRCDGELDRMNFSLNFKIYIVATMSAVQLLGLLAWALLAMCPTWKTKAEKKADKEIEADERWQAEVEKMETQMSQNRKARKAIRVEKAKDAERKVLYQKYQKFQEQRQPSQQ